MKKIILILCLAVAGIVNANAQTRVIITRPARHIVVTPARAVVVRPVRRGVVFRPAVVVRPVVVNHRRVVVVHH